MFGTSLKFVGTKPQTTRLFHTSLKVRKFDLQLETEIRDTIAALPNPSKLYKNDDGTSRDPSDTELKLLSKLTTLTKGRNISTFETFTINKEYGNLYFENQQNLENLVPSYDNGASGRIIDKIPYEDSKTGEVKWEVVRENEKEGWEKLMYYGFVPGLFLMLGVMLFKPNDDIRDWAEKELKLRAQEKFFNGDEIKAWESLKDDGLTADEKKKRDIVVVERILSGEYDRLAGLKINAQKLPVIEAEQ